MQDHQSAALVKLREYGIEARVSEIDAVAVGRDLHAQRSETLRCVTDFFQRALNVGQGQRGDEAEFFRMLPAERCVFLIDRPRDLTGKPRVAMIGVGRRHGQQSVVETRVRHELQMRLFRPLRNGKAFLRHNVDAEAFQPVDIGRQHRVGVKIHTPSRFPVCRRQRRKFSQESRRRRDAGQFQKITSFHICFPLQTGADLPRHLAELRALRQRPRAAADAQHLPGVRPVHIAH